MNVVVFTADENNGGIKQFTLQIYKTCLELGWTAHLFVPDCKNIEIPDGLENVHRHKKQKDILGITPAIFKTAREINNLDPDVVFFCDDAMYSIQILSKLRKTIKTQMVFHDITPHPAKITLKRKILNFISTKFYRPIAFKLLYRVVVLSNNSKSKVQTLYPKTSNKIAVLLLGSHPPVTRERKCPEEVLSSKSNAFLLFFGRIHVYKGINRLLRAFISLKDNPNVKLVIAGNGAFTKEESELLKSGNNNIVIINRFIEDSEMNWLFENCACVILPYIEASQSGVIPVSYSYGKPVIASNIEGIEEFVDDGVTGKLVSSDDELVKEINRAVHGDYLLYREGCLSFNKEFLNWQSNLKKIIDI